MGFLVAPLIGVGVKLVGSLLSCLFGGVDSVIADTNKQVQSITDTVREPLDKSVKSIVGTSWKGDGAKRFADEMNSSVIPGLDTIVQLTTAYNGSIGKAKEIISGAEQVVLGLVNGLGDVLSSIF